MAIVTDPDDLDRWQVLFDPVEEVISIRGLGANVTAKRTDGDVTGASAFSASGATFQTDGVQAGDVLTIASGTNIGHYTVATIPTETSLTINETFPDTGEAAGQTFRIDEAGVIGGSAANVADGVIAQTVYSFAKEEWRTLSDANMPDLVQFNFPLVSITREQFEIGDAAPVRATNWDWADDTTRNLVRTGGWSQVNTSGHTKRIYAGVLSLGSIDTDYTAYYQRHSVSSDPVDFVLPGPVNQAVLVFDEVTVPQSAANAPDYSQSGGDSVITRNDSGDFTTDGFEVGGLVTITGSIYANTDGTYLIRSITSSTLNVGSLTDGDNPITTNTDDTGARLAVDMRRYLKLRARKKARTYAEQDLADIGVTVLENIVNRMPLSHATDPAISADDGTISGDGTASGEVYQETEQQTSGSDGNTASNGDGTFAFIPLAAPTPAFNDGVLRAGDTLLITSGTYQGSFEIAAINGAGDIDCFEEPTLGAAPTQSSDNLTYSTRTAVLDSGLTNATLTDVDGDTGTLDSVGATFTTDDGLGDRSISADDIVLILAGDSSAIGAYKVSSVTDADTLVLDTSDQPITGGPHTNQTYVILRPGMHLQQKETTGTPVTPTVDFDDADATFSGSPPTIVRSTGSWVTDGFVAGGVVTVADAAVAGNNGTFAITSIDTTSTTNDTLILAADTVLTDDTADAITATPGEGFIRSLNSLPYSFTWRMFGNGGTLSQVFQYVQRQLRRGRAGETASEADIDRATTQARGDITDLLMTFASPNGVTLDMFVDDLAASEFNNVTKIDVVGGSRTFAFTAGVTITLNTNITNDADAKVLVFFDDPDGTPATGDEYGSAGAIIVQNGDGAGSPTVMRAITGGGGDNATIAPTLNFTFDYDNNAQGGRTPGTDAPVTIVAVGTDDAVYAQATLTIQRVNNNTASLVAALERNYSNP